MRVSGTIPLSGPPELDAWVPAGRLPDPGLRHVAVLNRKRWP